MCYLCLSFPSVAELAALKPLDSTSLLSAVNEQHPISRSDFNFRETGSASLYIEFSLTNESRWSVGSLNLETENRRTPNCALSCMGPLCCRAFEGYCACVARYGTRRVTTCPVGSKRNRAVKDTYQLRVCVPLQILFTPREAEHRGINTLCLRASVAKWPGVDLRDCVLSRYLELLV